MKKILLAAAVAVGFVGAAHAGGLADPVVEAPVVAAERWNEGFHWVGTSYYEFEAETFTTKAGVSYGIDRLTFSTFVEIADTPATDLRFEGMDFRVDYAITDNVTTFGAVETDRDFRYEEATIGVAWFF